MLDTRAAPALVARLRAAGAAAAYAKDVDAAFDVYSTASELVPDMSGLAEVLVSGDTTFDVYLAASELIPDRAGPVRSPQRKVTFCLLAPLTRLFRLPPSNEGRTEAPLTIPRGPPAQQALPGRRIVRPLA